MDAVFHVEHQVFNYRVGAVMIKEGRVLMHRAKTETNWSLPGGRVKLGEDAKMSLKREMKEELDLNVTVDGFLWTVENFFTYAEKEIHEVGLYFKITDENPLPLHDGEEFTVLEADRLVFKWVSLEDLNEYVLHPQVVKEKLIEGSFEPDYFLVDQS
ncbi:NUDIX hydrolase [Fictibacillus phosphorivorans]|jgi:ADP-ribose pyrophosphatase YjhB (NUDIX family)|uniref:NUDIX hydrolase n=1 Tax=Fictibacillus phosphorivorans TaxID=1221500 RepID=UPI0018E71273